MAVNVLKWYWSLKQKLPRKYKRRNKAEQTLQPANICKLPGNPQVAKQNDFQVKSCLRESPDLQTSVQANDKTIEHSRLGVQLLSRPAIGSNCLPIEIIQPRSKWQDYPTNMIDMFLVEVCSSPICSMSFAVRCLHAWCEGLLRFTVLELRII